MGKKLQDQIAAKQALVEKKQAAGKTGNKALSKLQALQAKQNPNMVAPQGSSSTYDPNSSIKDKTKDTLGSVYDVTTPHLGEVADKALKPLDFGALPAAPDTGNLQGMFNDAYKNNYGLYTQGFDQQKARDQQALDQQLAERGIMPGSGENYKNTMSDFSTNWDNKYAGASQRANQDASAGMLQNFNIGTAGRANALGEQQTDGTYTLNNLTGLMSLAQQPGQMVQGQNQITANKNMNAANNANALQIANIQGQNAINAAKAGKPSYILPTNPGAGGGSVTG